MLTPSFAVEAGRAGNYPDLRFNQRERKLLLSVLNYLNAGLSGSQLANGSISLAKLAPGITPADICVYAGTHATSAGSPNQSLSVPGVLSTDIVSVLVKTQGATPRVVNAATAAANAVNIIMSGDPSTDHVLQYLVFRAAS